MTKKEIKLVVRPHRVHFIGVGGIGISALAQYYRASGYEVTGSDAADSALIDDLRRVGIKIFIGHASGNVTGAEKVIYSAAVPEDNPERAAARRLSIPELSYAEALGDLVAKNFTIAVSGSHGKSTTTSMVALILLAADFDPTVIVGTKLEEFAGKNFRKGKGKFLVIEADEWNRSFHSYHPNIAVVTNVDDDHLDTYKNLRGVIAGFNKFLRQVSPQGAIIANYGDKNVRKAVRGVRARIIWYNRESIPRRKLKVPGLHNQLNAEAAAKAARALGIKSSVIEKALGNFRGVWRRLEEISKDVYTDYAHHPTEIRATLQALREKYPRRKIVAVFQPHQPDRLNRLFKDFTRAFDAAYRSIILPIYAVKGRNYGRGKTSKDLAVAIRRSNVSYAANFKHAMKIVTPLFREKAVAVFMSAGDLDNEVRRYF